ncbi:MAG: hypothetical protein ABJH08_05640 [Balneola sp.]
MQPNQESLELTLSDIENLSVKNQELEKELQLLYQAINDYPESGVNSIPQFIESLESLGLKSFNISEIRDFQQSLSISENAWEIESLESVLAFCTQIEENDFVNAVSKLKQKLRIA